MAQKTYLEFFNLIANLNLNVKDGSTKGQKKLQKIAQKIKPYLDEYNEVVDEIKIDCANVDQDGNLIFDENGNYKYSKEGLKQLNQKSRKLTETFFEFEIIEVINPDGLEIYEFLDGWVNGVKFNKTNKEEDVEL